MSDLAKSVIKTSSYKEASNVDQDKKLFNETHTGAVWMDDKEATKCLSCKKQFSVTRRRHHCRECGKIYCDPCSKYKIVVGGKIKRACMPCYKRIIESGSSQTGPQAVTPNGRAALVETLAPRVLETGDDDFAAADDIYGSLDFNTPHGDKESTDFPIASTTLVDNYVPNPAAMLDTSNPHSPWIHSILLVRSNESLAPSLEAIVPRGRLSEDTVSHVLQHSMPEILQPGDGVDFKSSKTATCEYNYTFRVRSKPEDTTEKDNEEYFNCFVAFREVMNISSSMVKRQSIVLVTRWPIPHFAFRLLGKIEEALWHVFNLGTTSTAGSEAAPGAETPAMEALATAYGQFSTWPVPVANTPLPLPFFGEILQLTLPQDMYQQHISVASEVKSTVPFSSPRSMSVEKTKADVDRGASPIFTQSNIISVFGPLGLLPHLWSFWELLMTGKDIIIVSEQPSLCSEVAIALSGLAQPNGFQGELWPYISSRGSDADDIGRALTDKNKSFDDAVVQSKKGSSKSKSNYKDLLNRPRRSMIIGITNPSLIKKLGEVAAVIFASPSPVAMFGLRRYSSKLSAAMRLYKGGDSFTSPGDFYLSSYKLWARGLQRIHAGADKREVSTMFAVLEEPSSGEQQRITNRLRKLSKNDFLALGSILLRDHFAELTRAFHKPLETSKEVSAVPEVVEEPKVAPTIVIPPRKVEEAPRTELTGAASVKDWVDDNRPTVILYALIAAGIILYMLVRLPLLPLIVLVYFVQIPARAPRAFELFLAQYIPESVLFPNKKTGAAPTAAAPSAAAVASTPAPVVVQSAPAPSNKDVVKTDFSGVWKRVKTINFDTFVGAQGASYVQRKLAASMPLTHTLTMNPDRLDAFRFQEKGGPLDVDNTYAIGGAPVERKHGQRFFEDTVMWSTTEPGVLIVKKIHVPERDFEIIANRYLENNGTQIRMTFKYLNYATKNEAEATAIFDKVGPSPHPPPDSPFKYDAEGAATTAPAVAASSRQSIVSKRPNLSGVWVRQRQVNIEAYVGVQGAGYLQKKLAANAPFTHIITTDNGACGYLGFRLQEKAGPVDSDMTYVVFGPPVDSAIMERKFKDTVAWKGETLTVTRVHEAGDFELSLSRRLDDTSDGSEVIELTSIHRDLITKKETKALSWWKRTGPSPNPPVVLTKEQLPVDPEASVMVPEAGGDNESEDGGSDSDNDEENTAPSGGKSKVPAFTRALSTAPRADMTGIWKRYDTVNYEGFVGAQGAGYVQRKLAASMDLYHTIVMDPPMYSKFILEEKGGPLDTHLEYEVGASEPVATNILKKKFFDTCDWEGDSIVVIRRHEAGDFELVAKRHLEIKDGEPVIRLVAIHRNLKTGEEVESISFFKKAGTPDLSKYNI